MEMFMTKTSGKSTGLVLQYPSGDMFHDPSSHQSAVLIMTLEVRIAKVLIEWHDRELNPRWKPWIS